MLLQQKWDSCLYKKAYAIHGNNSNSKKAYKKEAQQDEFLLFGGRPWEKCVLEQDLYIQIGIQFLKK